MKSEQSVEQTVELSMISDVMMLIWRHFIIMAIFERQQIMRNPEE